MTPPAAAAPPLPRRPTWQALPQAPASPELFAAEIRSPAKGTNFITERGEKAASSTQIDRAGRR